MSLFFYNLFIAAYTSAIRIAAIWNHKARLWVHGRSSFTDYQARDKNIWMHCASLGEFEQGRPLLEKIKQIYPEYGIVLTFFSPSGYEIRKNYKGADAIFYLPIDNPINAIKFINMIKPDLVLWVKYEYWYHYLHELNKRTIPVLLVSGIFRNSQPFFKWYGAIHREMLKFFLHLFVQNQESKDLITQMAQNVSVNGDTRFDRVIDIAENSTALPLINGFVKDSPVIVAGSTWEADEVMLVHFASAHPSVKIIIAPHEIHDEHIKNIQKQFHHSVLFSDLTNTSAASPDQQNILIIDNIGMLSSLYRYATITYIGGGFNSSGIHNVLEAAVYGKPVVFGPVYKKFAEARELVKAGGAFSITSAIELENILNHLLTNADQLTSAGNISKDYTYNNRGATKKILDYIAANRLLIS